MIIFLRRAKCTASGTTFWKRQLDVIRRREIFDFRLKPTLDLLFRNSRRIRIYAGRSHSSRTVRLDGGHLLFDVFDSTPLTYHKLHVSVAMIKLKCLITSFLGKLNSKITCIKFLFVFVFDFTCTDVPRSASIRNEFRHLRLIIRRLSWRW